jgi:hypothetical protein
MTDSSPIELSSRRKVQDNGEIRIRLALARINKLMAEVRSILDNSTDNSTDNNTEEKAYGKGN